MNVFGLFPIPIGVDSIDYNHKIDFESIIWNDLNSHQDQDTLLKKSKVSSNYNVLEHHSDLKKKIENSIKIYISDILCLDQDFQIVSSWLTKTVPGSDSNYHQHSNSWLSACFYFGEGSSIRFRRKSQTFNSSTAHSSNLYNSLTWDIPPEKNRILIFPSDVEHKILKNEKNTIRYSLSLNILPKGNFGIGDSKFHWPQFS